MENHRIYTTSFADVYQLYIKKAERKARTKAEVDQIISWLTGYDHNGLSKAVSEDVDFTKFFADAPNMNQNRTMITGVVCGIRVEDITHPLMREIRYLDKLIDELAKGRTMDKILRNP